jgi:class 3 adenylate cyclase
MIKRKKAISNLLQFTEALVADAADIFTIFSDLVGSTEYKNRLVNLDLPDIVWIQRQLVFLTRCADIIRKYGGNVVKTIGDEVFAYFQATADPIYILNCAIEIIQAFGNIKAYKGISEIHTKIAIDFGQVYNGSIDKIVLFDPIGVPVDRCARLISLAKADEIIFSKNFLEICATKKEISEIQKKYGYKNEEMELKGLGKISCYRFKAK